MYNLIPTQNPRIELKKRLTPKKNKLAKVIKNYNYSSVPILLK